MFRMVVRQSNRLNLGVAGNSPAAVRITAAASAAKQQQRSYAEVLPYLNPSAAAQASSDTSVADRYRAKLEQKAAAEGANSIQDLKDKYQDKIESQKKIFDETDPYAKINAQSSNNDETPTLNQTGAAASEAIKNAPKVPSSDIKDLDSFIDVSKFKLHNRKEIEMLWKMRFSANPRAICGIIEGDTFSHMYKNARQNPMFVLPLPREDSSAKEDIDASEKNGIEMHLVQWSFVGPYTIHCIFTTLAEYKLHQEYARPHTTLIIHSDLLADKGFALMNGNIEKDAAIGVEESHLLTLFLQKFYSASPDTEAGKRKLAILSGFTQGDTNFSIDNLVAEVERLD